MHDEKEVVKELHQLADDGCPHVEVPCVEVNDEAKQEVPGKTYTVRIPTFSPPVLRAMIGMRYSVGIEIDPETGGSIVSTMCMNDFQALCQRFNLSTPYREEENGSETKD